MKDVVEFRERRTCPEGDAPCPRDVGQRNGIGWRLTAAEIGRPDFVRVKIGGPTVDFWITGLDSWTPAIMPVRLLTNPDWRFETKTFETDPDPGAPQIDRESTFECDLVNLNDQWCGIVKTPGQPPSSNPERRWFFAAPGTYDVVVTALKKGKEGEPLTELCKVTRTYAVAARDRADPDRQAVDYYVNGGFRPNRTDNMDAQLHIKWHTARDKEPYFMGEDWLAFHRMLVKSFDDWRAIFGYPPVTPYDGSSPVPNSDGGYNMLDLTRPETVGGMFEPNCYHDGTGCAPQPWFTASGNGTARGDDLGTKKCHYVPDRNGNVEEVPTGQTKLADFEDARGLGCVLNGTHHRFMHEANTGAFHFIKTTPRDPLFWAYHKWASGYGPAPVPLGYVTPAAAPTESVLAAWERVKSAGPPGITAVFPPKGVAVSRIPGIQVLFWEPVTGVQPADLTVAGSPATAVVCNGAECVFSGFAVPLPPPAGGSVPLAIELASGAIEDLQGTPFPGDGWQFLLQHDADGDDIPDDFDDCPDVADPEQRNTDTLFGASFGAEHGDHYGAGLGLGDELGDACDPDDDGDTISDAVEIATGSDPLDWRSPDPCPLDPNKTDPGPCGCGVVEIGSGASLTCLIGSACEVQPGSEPPVHHVGAGGVAVSPPGCDDADPCTTDTCEEPSGCVNTELAGFDGLDCRVGRFLEPSLCGADPVDRKLGTLLAKKSTAIRKLIDKAEAATKAGKRRKLLKKSDALLRKLQKKVSVFAKKQKITPACSGTLTAMLDAARRLVPPLLP